MGNDDTPVEKNKGYKRFPLRLSEDFSNRIDKFVYHTPARSKHQYIIQAVIEKMESDQLKYKIEK